MPESPTVTSASRAWYERRWLRWARDVAIVVAVLAALRAYQQRDLPSGSAPDWGTARDLEGAPSSLAAYRGAPLMVHFWATWCSVCKAEQHNVVALAADLPVVAVASRSGPAAAVSNYLAQHPIGAKVLVDASGTLAARYGVRAFPTSFFLDGKGQIRHAEVGYTSELGMRLRMWLAGL